MVRSLLLACCALLCLFVLGARSEVNVPWPPSSLPECSAPWDRYGDAYDFCHVTLTGAHTSAEWDGWSVSDVEIEPCNWDYFLLDASSYGDLQVGDWLQVSIDYGVASAGTDSLDLLVSYTGLPPTSITNDGEFAANNSFSISPWTLSAYPQIWIGVGHYRRIGDTAPGFYDLSIERFRPWQECEECLCDPEWGYTEIPLSSSTDDQVVLTGSLSYSNDTRPDFDATVDVNYALLRNFHFNVPSSAYRPGAYLDINITILDDSTGALNAYLSAGPYAVDPKSSDYFWEAISLNDCGICPNGLEIAGTNCHLYLTPCDFYYGDYYLSIEFDDFCPVGASYEITVNVMAPVVQALTLTGSPSAVSFSNNLQTNIFLGAQAGYSQYDHYVLTVSGITNRTHAFARLTSVYGYNMGLFMRSSDQASGAVIAYEDRDRVLVPREFNGNATCDDSCYNVDYFCQTTDSSIGQVCGCSFLVRSCDLEETDYYLSVVPFDNSEAFVDVQSYHIEVSTYEDNLQATLVPCQPISTTLAVWSPFQIYVFATPNTVDTWAVFELFVRAPSTTSNQLAQPGLTLDLLQNFASINDAFVCSDADTTALQTCTTSSLFYTAEEAPSPDGVSVPGSCHLTVDACKLNYGAIYLSVYPDSADISSYGINGGQWDYVLWGDLETAWALESDVTYTDRVRVNQYNHYYIDVDESIEAGSWLSVDFEFLTPLNTANFISYLNYESLAGDCPCYENLDSCLLSSGTATAESCDSAAESCNTDVNGWSSDYGYDLADNSYPVITENSGGACRVQATVCAFRPGRWFVSTTAVYSSGGSGGKSVVPENAITAGSQPVDSSNSVNLVGYSMTARIHSAPVVNELEFNTLVTELLTPSEILHFQLTQIDAPGDDLVVTVNWYSEILSRFYAAEAGSSDSSYTLPKAIFQDWGIELRLNFGDLAFDECYEHPWSCKAYALNGGSCQIIVPACKWAVVDPQQIFVSARYNRGYFDSEYFPGLFAESDYAGSLIEPLDVLAPQLWVGDAQINLQVTSERAEVTSLAIGSPIYGSVLADRYAHYSFQLLSTQALRTDIDVYFFVQSSFDLSESYPIVALNSGSLAGNGRGCRDCFSVVQSCQNNINCHWTFDSCNGLSTDTTYYLSVYKPVNAFFNQALEFSVLVSQQELIIPVSLGAANRLTSTIVLQDSLQTRAFFAIDGSSLPERATPLDYLSIRIWNSGIVSSDFTYYLNHDSLAGSCECFGARCQETVSLSNECPITASSGNFIEIVDNDLTAGTYFLTLEFASVDGSDAVVLTIEAEAVIYDVVARTPTNLRESGTEFYLGDANLRYGEDITLDYNEGYNMDNWLVFNDNIDWDETNNVIRNEKIYGVSIPSVYGLETPARFSDGSLATKFYAITVTNPATEPGHVLPDRVFLGIDNIRSDIDNCYTVGKGELTVSWYGTQEQALSSVLSNVNNDGRTCAINSPLASTIGQTTASADSQLLFTELPVCLFTHAQTATHLFAVTFSPAENDAWSLSLADGASNEEIFPAVIFDIRFFLQKPIAMQDLDAFYVGPSYLTETVGYPYTTNWQPLQNAQLTGLPAAFKQRFSLDLSGSADISSSLVQVVIETDDELSVTVNGDYAPNFNNAEGCWVDSCTSRSLLEFREATLSYLQLNTAAFGDSVVSAAANNTLSFADPDANLVYTCAPPSCVFTLDPCALSQSSLWYFDIVSANGNSSFAIYYTAPEPLLTDIYDISATDIEERNWVPGTDATFGGVDGVDNYEFFRISNEVLTEVLSGEGRARLEIQIEWQTKTTTEDFANDQWASIVISPEAPVYVRGQQGLGSNAGFTGFPFYTSRGQTNVAYTESVLPSISTDQFLYNTYESDIPFCFEPFYISVSGGAYNNTNTGASGSERLFLDGCDLQGISELWLTARMLTPGFFDYQYLVRVVRDKEIDLTDLTIGSGYANAATNLIPSDTVTAIEPNSFNHNKFLLPTDLQTGSASTLIVELFFPDDAIDRNNGTFWLLFSADAPAGWASIYSPDSYVINTDARYPVYVGLPTFGAQASFGSDDSTVGAQTNYDCYSNLVDYSADVIIFNDDDTGLVPVDNFANEYRSRRSIDLFNFRYATYLYVSVFYEGVWEPTFPDSETETELWQGYELNVWIQPEPSASSPFIINQNISTEQVCFDGLDGVTTDTGIYPNEADFDLNISWAGYKSLTPTWFTFELDESLISLDCSLSATTPECYFTQYLEFQIFNDDFLQDYTFNGSPTIALDGDFTVFGPGSISIGGANDFETASSNSDIFGGKWIVQDSHLASDHRFFASPLYLDLNASSPAIQFGPCSSADNGFSYLPDRDWNFGEAFAAPQGFYTLRPGTYYIPVWSADSLDFTICATLNSIGYDYTWTTVTSPYEPQELTAYDTDDVDSSVVTLAQAVVDWNNETTARYDYYWFSLSDADIASSEQYLQIWLDRVAVCTDAGTVSCTALPENDDLILQMFRSDCQLWSCDANGEGAGCEGRWTTGSSNEDGDYGVVSRFILGGAGLSPCSLTAGDFFIKVNLPQAATYTLSAYLRTPPTVVSLAEAVAVRSTIYSTAFQHYVFTAADTSSSLLTSLSVSLSEVLCGSLEMFAKHGTPAGPFYPTNFDATTFIGSQMYYPSQSLFGVTRFAGSSLEKCASAYCAADGETSCTINIGTTELSKDLDATGLIGSTTWYFAVRSISTKYHTDNDASNGGDLPWDVSDSTEGNGFNEPTTYFITATTTYSDLFTSQSIGCSVTPATSAGDVCSGETTTSNDNAQIYQFGFQTITLFTNALVDSPTVPYSVNATVHASFAAVDGVNQFVEPIELETGTWSYELSAFTDLSVVGPKNVFYDLTTGGTVFADFYHHPVTALLPGVTYPSTGFSPSALATSSSFLTADHIYYEFSPALTSTPSFSLTYINTDGENCLHPRFWTETDCGVYTSARPDDNDFFTSCGVLPRFFSFYLDEACSSSCSTGSCDTPFQWEFSYSTSLPITELDLGVVSCGSAWETTLITGELSGSTSHYWLLFSLPTTPDFDGTTANWLSLDFYPNLADSIDSSDILFFESSSFTCGVSQETERDSSFDTQTGFVCPSFGYLAARTNVFSLDYTESSVTPSLFSIPVIASDLSLSSATGVSSVSIPIASTDLALFDYDSAFAIYSFTVPAIDSSVSWLTVAVDTGSCGAVSSWLNFGTPVPAGCDDVAWSLIPCQVNSGVYYVSVRADLASSAYYPEWAGSITVTLKTDAVLDVPAEGNFSASYTIDAGASVILQTSLPSEWLKSHPALQSEIIYRVISPLGIWTLDVDFNSEPSLNCFDCQVPVVSTELTNNFDAPFTFTVQFELVTDLLYLIDPDMFWIAPAKQTYIDISTAEPLWDKTFAFPLLTPYLDQRAATVNTLALGVSVSPQLYNAFTSRQIQVYVVDIVTANSLAQLRVANVVGGVVSMQVFAATLDRSCGEFKECHSAPIQWSQNHQLLQANPLNNIAGSCSVVYNPCEWAASPSWFVVLNDHVLNNPQANLEIFTSPLNFSGTDGFNFTYSPENSTLTNPPFWNQMSGDYVPSQNNPFVAVTFDLIVTEESWTALNATPSASQSFLAQASTPRSADNPAGNWQHFFYSYEASGVTSVRIIVDVSAASALATSGVWVTVTDSDCGCGHLFRNVWCSAEYPSWLCEIEVALHAEHPLESTTFYVDVYGLKGSFTVAATEGVDGNCVSSDGESFCPTRVLNYPFWPSLDSSDLDNKASCLYDELLSFFESPCDGCFDVIGNDCQLALMDYACAATFQPCDVNGFIDASICVDKCTAVESACPFGFVQAGLPNLDCGHARYSISNCF